MIAVFCLLLILGLGHCQDNDLPSLSEIESSINRTVDEVERMVRENPKLPRLSRQEIVNILYNITSKEVDSYQDQEKMERARSLYQRALMVVLPYNAGDSTENLKELYTKPPMTQMVQDMPSSEEIKPEEVENPKKENTTQVKNNNDQILKDILLTTENILTTQTSTKITTKEIVSTTPKNRYKNHRITYSEIHTKAPLKETLKRDSAPVRFSFNLENLQKKAQTAENIPITTRRPIFRKDLIDKKNQNNSKLEIVYSTSASLQETTMDANVSKTVAESKESSGSKNNQNILSSDQWQYNAPPSTTATPISTSKTPSKIHRFRGKPGSFSTTPKSTTEESMMITKRPEILKKIPKTTMKTIRVRDKTGPVYVTPMPSEQLSKMKYSSTYSVKLTTSTSSPMRSEVMDLLASIGLRPDNGSNVEDVYKKNKDLLESKLQIPDSNSVVYTTSSALSANGPDSTSISSQNTFEAPGSEIKKGVQNLTPDVQLLFQKFGLQTSNLGNPTTSTTQRTTVTNSYTNFKPLPTSSVKDQEMREFLARFGLGVDGRREKSVRPVTKRPSVIEAVPSNMRSVLENIGLVSKKNLSKHSDLQTRESKLHVFKPHEVNVSNEEQRVKINELLDTVKLVQQGKGDIDAVHKAAKDLLQSTKTLKGGPDPLSLEEIIHTYKEDVKNEVKRQQQQEQLETSTASQSERNDSTRPVFIETTTSMSSPVEDSASLATGSMDSSSTAAIASSTSNLKDLEDSFGGTTKAPDPVLPTRPKTGLYFLVDWNTFLEVGEDDREKVNLRFQPKVGDRTRFLPVTVP